MSRTEHHYNCDYPFEPCDCDWINMPEPKPYMPTVGNWIWCMVMWTFLFLLNLGAIVFDLVVGVTWVMSFNVIGCFIAPVLVYKSHANYHAAIARRAEIRKERYQRWLDTPAPQLTQESVTWAEYEAQVERMLKDCEDPWAINLDHEQVTALALAERRRQESELAYRNGPEPHPDSLESYTKQFGDQIAHLYRIQPPTMSDDEREKKFRKYRNRLDRLPPR